MNDLAVSKLISFIASLKRDLSSAKLIASLDAPIISTLYVFKTPNLSKSSAQFNAVCPPIVGKIASGFSILIIFSTIS